jgi:Patatin-like phospholipase
MSTPPLRPTQEYIPETTIRGLRDAAANGALDPSSRALLDAETRYILGLPPDAELNPKDEPYRFAGIGLSGGGIRSATFALGVLQALAAKNLLGHFRYLSTVSGGGYIGTALTWWLGRGNPPDARDKTRPAYSLDDPQRFPYGTVDPADPHGDLTRHPILGFLRQHGEYITPGEGIDWWTAIGAVLRGMILNMTVWIGFWIAVMFLVIAVDTPLNRLFLESLPDWFTVPLALATVAAGAYAALSIVYSLSTAVDLDRTRDYLARRTLEQEMGIVLFFIALCAVVASAIIVSVEVAEVLKVAGPSAVAVGLATSLRTFTSTSDKAKAFAPDGVIAGIGAFLLLYGVLVCSFMAAAILYYLVVPGDLATDCGYCQAIVGSMDWLPDGLSGLEHEVAIGMGVGGACVLLLGFCVNVNFLSLHRYYRDRLLEAFMPDPEALERNAVMPARRAERQMLCEALPDRKPGEPLKQPYPLICSETVLVMSPDRIWENRGGDSFLLSPLYCGSNATGWRRTDQYSGGRMALATAMAISGAALNPDAGGAVPRNRWVALLLAWLNLRLGFWARHPRLKSRLPNHFYPGLYEFRLRLPDWLGWFRGFREDSRFQQLSDGGHFENLGVYELVRRRAHLIVVCDGDQDQDFTFGDLNIALNRVSSDFGARIVFDADNLPERLAVHKQPGYQRQADLPDRGYIVGRIYYPETQSDADAGWFVYIKATLIKTLRPEVLAYQAANPEFPDQSTSDQWFNEDQFEAYRELGFTIAKHMLEDRSSGRSAPSHVAETIAKFAKPA